MYADIYIYYVRISVNEISMKIWSFFINLTALILVSITALNHINDIKFEIDSEYSETFHEFFYTLNLYLVFAAITNFAMWTFLTPEYSYFYSYIVQEVKTPIFERSRSNKISIITRK